uniref:Aspartic proteinase nepenthesin-2 n=1 Tax=Anthurium amnicola TaxID=1678845 RepID=A0A1D1XIX3_9ARAE
MGSSRDPFLLLLCVQVLIFLLPNNFAAPFFPVAEAAAASADKRSASLILPLKTQQIPSGSIPRPPNKLYFHHNVSLTVPLTVGSPPQNVSMVLDTGSELSWLRCSGNSTASASGPSFRPLSSSSYVSIPCASASCQVRTRDLPSPAFCGAGGKLCRVSMSYADGSSADGDLASDIFRVGQLPAVRALFGCVDTSFSSTGEDAVTAGLLGMNRGSLSLVSQMGTRRFSYCISDRDSTGVLLLGGDGPGALPFPVPLNYTPLIQISLPLPYFDRVAYSVQLEGIRVGATLLPIPKSVLVPDHTGAGQTMVDSGSQFTFLLGPAYAVLKSEFLRQTRGKLAQLGEPGFAFQGAFDTCFRVPTGRPAPAPMLPEVVLLFRGGAEVAVAGERLLYQAPGEVRGGGADAVWCLTFGNSDLVPLEAYVIGHHHQQNVWVEYDLAGARVGFAPVRCDLASQRLGAVA